MAEFYSLGNKLATDKDIKKISNKINISGKLYTLVRRPLTKDDLHKLAENPTNGGNLSVIHQRTPDPGNDTYGIWDTLLLFSGDDVFSVIDVNVDNTNPRAKILSGSITYPDHWWSKEIAWKSDIQRLEDEIADLKKQIGGYSVVP